MAKKQQPKKQSAAPAPIEALTIAMWPTDKPIPYARNARKVNDRAIDTIAASLKEYGWRQPLVVDAEGVVVVGHTRLLGAKKLGMPEVPVHVAHTLTPAQCKAYRLMDNRAHENTAWDFDLLEAEMMDLEQLDVALDLTGFDAQELEKAFAGDTGGDGDGDARPPSDGSMLERLNVTVDDPKTVIANGDVWRLGRHVLVCGSVVEDWPRWQQHLTEGSLFVPFPGPFVLLSERAADTPLVLVQPDSYIAGHVVDRYIDIHGDAGVQREQPAA